MKPCLLFVFMMSIGVLSERCWGQQTPDRFLVLSYERTAKSEGYINLEYFWIIPYDNLGSNQIQVFPFAFGNESTRYQKDDCADAFKKLINYPDNEGLPILQGDVLADMNYNGIRKEELEHYMKTINDANSDFLRTVFLNRKLIQECSKKWLVRGKWPIARGKETLKVYITPVRATLKKGWFYSYRESGNPFSGYAYYLDSPIEYDDTFWTEFYSKRVRIMDYSYLFYAKYTAWYDAEDFMYNYIIE